MVVIILIYSSYDWYWDGVENWKSVLDFLLEVKFGLIIFWEKYLIFWLINKGEYERLDW